MPANLTTYGFWELKDVAAQRIVTIDVQTLRTAITQSLNEWSRMSNEFDTQLVQRTTDYKRRYQLASSGSLQPLDQMGNPLPVQPAGSYDIAFPIQGAGTAWGANRVSNAMMTVEDADRATFDSLQRDFEWRNRHKLAALYTNTTWTYTDPMYGALVVQPLANGDTVTYVRKGGLVATDNHYLAQAAAIADATNPYPLIYAALDHHPSNTGPYIAYIPTNLVATTEALLVLNTNFNAALDYRADVSVPAGASVDFDKTRFGGNITHFGDRLIGYANGMYIVEWALLPNDYIIGHASGTNDVLGMREYPVPELQGFFPEFNAGDGNSFEYRMIRYAGYGVMNRIGAVIYRVSNGAYAIPTGYTAPLPA